MFFHGWVKAYQDSTGNWVAKCPCGRWTDLEVLQWSFGCERCGKMSNLEWPEPSLRPLYRSRRVFDAICE